MKLPTRNEIKQFFRNLLLKIPVWDAETLYQIKEAKERIYYLLALKKNDICQQLNIKTYQGTSILHLSENEQAELGKLMWEYVRLLTEKISNKIIHMVYHC